MNTPRISQDLYDELQKSTPFITCDSKGDPDPKEREYEVRLKFRTMKQSHDFHDKLCRFANACIADEILVKTQPEPTVTFDGRTDSHPLHKAIYDLCQEIEKLPASEQATICVSAASALNGPVAILLAESKVTGQMLDGALSEWQKAKAFKAKMQPFLNDAGELDSRKL